MKIVVDLGPMGPETAERVVSVLRARLERGVTTNAMGKRLDLDAACRDAGFSPSSARDVIEALERAVRDRVSP